MVTAVKGPINWNLGVEEEGHYTYTITHLVESDDPGDGPAIVSNTPGLPQPGDPWHFFNDFDDWVWCLPTMTVIPVVEVEKNLHWHVTQYFSSRLPDLCRTERYTDPLLEPDRISGTFTKYQEEARYDRFGNPITNSAHEALHGPAVEFDANRPTVRIEQNVADLELDVFSSMIDTVNDAPMWGLPERCIKLSNVTWEKHFRGDCDPYYTRALDFDVKYDTFDRDIRDEGTKVLNGHWDTATGQWTLDPVNIGGVPIPPDKNNPTHFIRYQDPKYNLTRVLLDGNGKPVMDINLAGEIHVEKYDESNFFLLGVPAVL